MTTLFQDIRGALQARALTAAGFPAAANVQFEGRTYKPVIGTTWARMILVPSSSRPFTVDAGTRSHRGLFWVTVFTPGAGSPGTAAAQIAADAVVDVFAPGLRLAANGEIILIEYAERQQTVEQIDWTSVPVSVAWRCHSARP